MLESFDPFHIPPTTIIHHVEIIRPIKRGGQAGIVYLVAKPFQSAFQRRVFMARLLVFGINRQMVARYQLGAIKIAKQQARDDILDELRILKKIQNIDSHIAQEYYTSFGHTMMRSSIMKLPDADGKEQPYRFVGFVYESGGSLADLIQQRQHKPFTPAQTVHIAQQIMTALQALHQHGVVYNDLSASNVMLRDALSAFRPKNPMIVLIDFGASEETNKDYFRQVIGKPLYLPPERRPGLHNNPMNLHGDTYSLGILMYELLVGKIEFQSQSFPDLLSRKQRLAQTPPTTTLPLSPELRQLVMDAIICDVAERRRKLPNLQLFRQRLEATPEFRQSGAIRAPITRKVLTQSIAVIFFLLLSVSLSISAIGSRPTPVPIITSATITSVPTQTQKPTATATAQPSPTLKPTATLIPSPTVAKSSTP